jgi:hypothetical protein
MNIKLGNKSLSLNKSGYFVACLIILAVCIPIYKSIVNMDIYVPHNDLSAKVPTDCKYECGNSCYNAETQGCCAGKVYNLKTQECFLNCSDNSLIESLTRDLSLDSAGKDVSDLQNFLVQKGFLTMPIGVSTGYFGKLTKTALENYQLSEKIIESKGSGYFGLLTRARIVTQTSHDLGIKTCKLTSGEIIPITKKVKTQSDTDRFLALFDNVSNRKKAQTQQTYRECEGSGHRKPNSFYRKLNSYIITNKLEAAWQSRINDLPDGFIISVKNGFQDIFDIAKQVVPLMTDAMLCACMTPEQIELAEVELVMLMEDGLASAEYWPDMSKAEQTAYLAQTKLAKTILNNHLERLKKQKPNCKRMLSQCPWPHKHGGV